MTTDALQDAGARARALDVEKSFIVQAPAGSGKTGLLTQRFLRLLAAVDRPEEILAITFTRKAAAEMRLRIVQALREARDGVAAENAFHAALLTDARAALERDAAHEWGLVSSPARLQIMTLDALNGRLIGAMPVTSRTARVRIVEAELQDQLYTDASASLLDWLTSDDARGRAARHFLSHLDASGFVWHRHIAAMLRRRDQWLPTLLHATRHDRGTLRDSSELALASLVTDAVERVDTLMPRSAREPLLALLRGAHERLAERGDDPGTPPPDAWPPAHADAIGFWRNLAGTLLTQKNAFRKRVTVNDGFPPSASDDKAAFTALLETLSEQDGLAEALGDVRDVPDPRYDDAQWETIGALLELLPVAAAELERLMAERGVADYTALAASAVGALGDPDSGRVTDLALRLDYRIRHILVDEMQDTAPAQYALLRGLTAGWSEGDGRTVFCVGDPMQSIYRFRGADVSLFLDAWERGIGELNPERLLLSTNFRSARGIIEWVNGAFPAILGDVNDPLTDAVAYRASSVAPDAEDGGNVQWHTGVDDAAPGAETVVATVRALRDAYPGDSIGILARTRGALEPVLAALRREAIPCEAVDMDRLTDLPEIIDLVNITRALEHDDDRIAWLGLLRSPLVGWSLEQIDTMLARARAHDIVAPIPELLATPRCTAHLDAHGAALLERLLGAIAASRQAAAMATLRERVEHCWTRLGGPAALADAAAAEHAWQFLDALARLERDGQLDSLPGLVDALDALHVSRLTDRPEVFAMTIFRSKGLEFDHVLVPELQARTQSNARPPIVLDMRSVAGDDAVLFSIDTSRAEQAKDPLHELLLRRERLRDRNELDRLLYVAATRARRSLHLFAGAKTLKDGSLSVASADTLLGRFGDIARRAFDTAEPDAAAAAEPAGAGGEAGGEWLTPHHRRIAQPWQAPPLPAPGGDARFRGQAPTDAVQFDWAGSGARHVGTVVHTWLDRLAGSGDPQAALQRINGLAPRSRALLAQLGVPADAVDGHVERVVDALQGAVNGADARWLIGSNGPEDRAEFALGALSGGRVVRHVIDRIVRDDAGDLWIVDYKSSRHEGGDLEGFFANECRRYRAQLAAYADAVSAWYRHRGADTGRLRLGLYFTLYGRLVELDASPDG